MSSYTDSYKIRYQIPHIQQQIEVSVINATKPIFVEPPNTTDHSNRLKWANWANKNSSVAWVSFAWPVGLDSKIAASVAVDPSGQTVVDGDVQAVVNANLDAVIADFKINNP